MSLNIKNPKAYELAALTGESLTAAVIVALAERLEAEKVSRGLIKSKVERMRDLAARFKAGMDPAYRSEVHAAMLFDENGMPFWGAHSNRHLGAHRYFAGGGRGKRVHGSSCKNPPNANFGSLIF